MKLAIILAALLAPLTAHAETFAFVDSVRVYSEATEAKRVTTEIQADRDTKEREIGAAQDAVKRAQIAKAKPADVQSLQQKADALAKMDSDDFAKQKADATAALRKRVGEVAAKLAADRHVTILPVTPLYPVAGRDLTDELIRRLNASDQQAMAEENARLKAKVAALEAAKPTAPHPAGK